MLLEIVSSTVMAGLFGYTFLDSKGVTEASRIQRISVQGDLKVLDKGKVQTIHLLRKGKHEWGNEYVYRIPLGLCFEDFQKKSQLFQDGLNHRQGANITVSDVVGVFKGGDVLENIKKLLNAPKTQKEILMDYDGCLRIKVYKAPLSDLIPFDNSILDHCSGWRVVVGTAREGMILHDFDKIPHLVVAGTTRYGKSVFLKNVITTLIHSQPKNVRFTLLDLKGGLAFNRFKNLQQVDAVAKDVNESLESLRGIKQEMLDRQREFLAKGYEDVKESRYQQRKFIIIDEGAELSSHGEADSAEKKKRIECERIVAEIARIGGGLGFRLIFSTQYPTGDTLPRQVKQNCDAKLCFRLQTDTASSVVLDEAGAEKLPFIQGRAIYRTDRKYIVQTPLIENAFITKVIEPHITIKGKEFTYDPYKPKKETNEAYTAGGKHTLLIE